MIGTFICIASFTTISLTDQANSLLSGFLGYVSVVALVAPLLIAFGTVATGICLMLCGWPLARLTRKSLASAEGIIIAISGALIVSAAILAIFDRSLLFEPFAHMVLLGFAVPAALFYRDDILTERVLD